MSKPASRSPTQIVEAFHLTLLRVLEMKLDRARYVIKGGVNLRAWFGSLRYSEDMDIDAVDLAPHVLEDSIDRLLASRDLELLLRMQGLALAKVVKPKQAETTQRWKFELASPASAVTLRTKIEFSHRSSRDDYLLEPVRPEILRPYGIPAPTANHYTAASAIRQINAVAQRAKTQARDVWDLDHLFRTTSADPRPLPPTLRTVLPVANDRIHQMSFDDYKAQIIPFLEPEHHDLYGTREAWDRMRELVLLRLAELGP